MSTEKKLQHIVIVGGGFAGFLLAKRINPEKFRVTLVDRKNFHAFPPRVQKYPSLVRDGLSANPRFHPCCKTTLMGDNGPNR